MYNSFIVRIFVGAGNAFSLAYKSSILISLVDVIKRYISYLSNGSIIIDIFAKNLTFIENSLFYKLFSKVLNFLSRIVYKFNRLFNRVGEDSIICQNARMLFGNGIALIRTLSVFVLFFAVGIILINLDSGLFWGRSYIVSIILILGAIKIIALDEDLIILLENSSIYRFLKNLFIIDEGGGQWW